MEEKEKEKETEKKQSNQLVITTSLIVLTIIISLLLDADVISALIYSVILVSITDESNQSVILILLGIILVITNL
ncbi:MULTISPECIES: hypothetical protein [Bacillaceae]|uniref:Uncharacterized protein n=1 Tax=Evansella alkalicola TaxID=745819 RepID=A0ABS6JXF4_9BACI|nr:MULTISPECIES: hypothetical protein [Bacillaceae]MBU9723279.1 hypothetical protein [Bacillus alkalicola]